MAMTPGVDGKGRRYSIDWAAATQVISAYAYMEAFAKKAHMASEGNFLGRVKTVDIDPRMVQNIKRDEINDKIPRLLAHLQADATRAQEFLTHIRRLTMLRREDRDRMFAVAEGSARSFTQWADIALGTTQLVRDVGFASVAVIGAPMGGGVALTAAMTAATGSGFAKYSETGNAGAAVLSGGASLLMAGYGRLAGAAVGASKGIMLGMGVVLDSTFEMFGGMAEGKSTPDIIKAMTVKVLTGGLGITLDHVAQGEVTAIASRISNLVRATMWRDAATLSAIELAKKTGEKGINMGADWVTSGRAAVAGPGRGVDPFIVQKVLAVH